MTESDINEFKEPEQIEFVNFLSTFCAIQHPEDIIVNASPRTLRIFVEQMTQFAKNFIMNAADQDKLHQFIKFPNIANYIIPNSTLIQNLNTNEASDTFYDRAVLASQTKHSTSIDTFRVRKEKSWINCVSTEKKEEKIYDDYGWKLHISVRYHDLKKAVNIVAARKDFRCFKFMDKDNIKKFSTDKEQASKTITIYIFFEKNKSIAQIAEAIKQITHQFEKENVHAHEEKSSITDKHLDGNPYFSGRNDLAVALFSYHTDTFEHNLISLVDITTIHSVLDTLNDDGKYNYRLVPGYARVTSNSYQDKKFKVDVMFKRRILDYFNAEITYENQETPSLNTYAPGGIFPLSTYKDDFLELTACLEERWSQLLFSSDDSKGIKMPAAINLYSLAELKVKVDMLLPRGANVSLSAIFHSDLIQKLNVAIRSMLLTSPLYGQNNRQIIGTQGEILTTPDEKLEPKQKVSEGCPFRCILM